MIKKAWKKNIAILLVIAMMLTIMPMTVFAEGEEGAIGDWEATITASATEATTGQSITFKATATTSSAISFVEWSVNPTSGTNITTDAENMASISFSEAGSYAVSALVIAEDGTYQSDVCTVTITEATETVKVDPSMDSTTIQEIIDENDIIEFAEGTYENLTLIVDGEKTITANGHALFKGNNKKGTAITLKDNASLTMQGGEFEITDYAIGIRIGNGVTEHNFTMASGILNLHDLNSNLGCGGIVVGSNDGSNIHILFKEGTSYICTNSYSGIEIWNNNTEKTVSVYTTFDGCEVVNLSDNGTGSSGSGIQAANSSNIYQEIMFRNCGKVNLDNNHLDAICFQGSNTEKNSSLWVIDCKDISFSGNNSWGTNGGDINIINSQLTVNRNSYGPWGAVSKSASNLCSENLFVDNSTIYANESGTFCGVWVQEKAEIKNNSKIYTNNNGYRIENKGLGCYFAGDTLIENSEIYATENKAAGIDFDYEGQINNSRLIVDDNNNYDISSWKGNIEVTNSFLSNTDTGISFYHMGYGDTYISRLKVNENTVARLQATTNEITENYYGRTYVLGGSLQAKANEMYPKSGSLGLNGVVNPLLQNGEEIDKDWPKPINEDGTGLTRFNLNAEINQEVGATIDEVSAKTSKTFTYYDPHSNTKYDYTFRYNVSGEDLVENESGNAYVWTPVSILHFDATEGSVNNAESTAVIGNVALTNTRGDGSSVGNVGNDEQTSSRYATDYTIYGNSLQLSEGIMPTAEKENAIFRGWYVADNEAQAAEIAAHAGTTDEFLKLYALLNTEFTAASKVAADLNDVATAQEEKTIYAKWAAAKIEGTVFHDTEVSRNNQYDAGEDVFAGIAVSLKNAAGDVISTAATDENGHYEFYLEQIADKTNGDTYMIELTEYPEGMSKICDVSQAEQGNKFAGEKASVTITVNQGDIKTANAGFYQAGVIEGYVFEDGLPAGEGATRDNTYVAEFDKQLANVRVELFRINQDGITYVADGVTTTTALGYYRFDNLIPNERYFVYVQRPEAYNMNCDYAYDSENLDGDRFQISDILTGENDKALYCSDIITVLANEIERANAGFYYMAPTTPDNPPTKPTPSDKYDGPYSDNPTTEIPDTDVPATDPSAPSVDVAEPDVPATEVPGTPVSPTEVSEEVSEPEASLGDAPKTGDAAPTVALVGLMAAAAVGLFITRRKFN